MTCAKCRRSLRRFKKPGERTKYDQLRKYGAQPRCGWCPAPGTCLSKWNRRPIRTLIVDTTNADSGVFTLCEICERGERHEGSVTKPVNHDILSLIKEHHCPLDWQLDAIALTRLQRALRLQQNLALNFPGLLNLLNEVQQMCREMSRLNQCFLPLSEEWTT